MNQKGKQIALKAIYKAYAQDPAFERLRTDPPQPKRVVPGRGSMSPKLVLVGEAPGRMEASTRKPFMGAAGQVLNKLLASIDLERKDVFITNAVKYRPTIGQVTVRNRTPTPDEWRASRPYLLDELGVFHDVPVVLLGKVAAATMMTFMESVPMHELHGHLYSGPGRRDYTVLYHPAAAVYQPELLEVMLEDMQAVRTRVGASVA